MRAPAQDARGLSRILKSPQIGRFDEVVVLEDEPRHRVEEALGDLLADRRPDDMVLVYFTGHGITDERNKLHFVTSNSRHDRLATTAVSSAFVSEQLENCRAGTKVVLLDCCFSGAFPAGFVAKAAPVDAGLAAQLPGRGFAIIASSGELEYAFTGEEKTLDKGRSSSVFTDVMIEGLRTGKADRDGDGRVEVSELYDYVRDEVAARAQQTPTYIGRVSGTIYLTWVPPQPQHIADLVMPRGGQGVPRPHAILPAKPTTQVPATARERGRARWQKRIAGLVGGQSVPSLRDRVLIDHPIRHSLLAAGFTTATTAVVVALLGVWFDTGDLRSLIAYVLLLGAATGVYHWSRLRVRRWRYGYIGLYSAGHLDPVAPSPRTLLIPVGHVTGGHRSSATGQLCAEIRLGSRFLEVSADELAVWQVAHRAWGKESIPFTRQDLECLQVGAGAARASIDRLIHLDLLVEVRPGTRDVVDFARSHRFVPLLLGLGNTTTTPWLYRIGMIDRTLIEVHTNVYRIFVASPAQRSLWHACVTVAREEAILELDMFIRSVHALLSVEAGHFDRASPDPDPTRTAEQVPEATG
ncbi:hypothetical protein BJ970_006948 [Saccharopolyspora phatthalungensis]|uniref:Peptidase C14 caspase domain-containing protein n=2 Tax=Saccharopolyspora phatthalungensis TaxID=664693 RepID=A0A840QJP5_9PSEU|nr:hypothetical protein [Saccharopolyspora phatthalungensis]